uniref:NADH dehydrogenase subunit 6 n=1 Tax=Orthotomicus erosus TaxID=55869 RepID=UPI001EDE333C|nr:NADH dehydrogenase subunit 6 [Orthotomicus erosus]UJX85645.1 NADH dehydrogenase subunit 6 [Orthotomicus erosus]
MSLITILSCIFIFLNHPLALGGILFIQTVFITISSGMLYSNFWYSYLLFLIMISGMLILFMYMTSIASNEKFSIPSYWKILLLTFYFTIFSLFALFLEDTFFEKIKTTPWNFFFSELDSLKPWMLSKFFNTPFNQIIIFLMIYLFLTLIMTVKLTGKSLGPLRQKSQQ